MRHRIAIWSGLGTLVLSGLAAGGAIGSSAKPIPDVQQLYHSATLHVRGADGGLLAKAVLYEADGYTAHGRAVSTAAGITHWHFVFANPTPKSPYAHATINYGPRPKGYGKVTAYKTPFLEDIEIARAPKVSLARAVALLRRAGHQEKFDRVILRDPIAPPFDGPRYIFEFPQSSRVIAVNARTGAVTTLR